MLRKLTELFFAPWAFALSLFALFGMFSGFHFTNKLNSLTQYFALHPSLLSISWIVLLTASAAFVISYLTLFSIESWIQPAWKRCSDKQKGIILLVLLLITLMTAAASAFAWAMLPMPVPAKPSAPITNIEQGPAGTPVLFEMRIPPTAAQIAKVAKEKRQEAAFIKKTHTRNLPPPPLFQVKTKIIHGRADIKQIGPDTYQITMLHPTKS